MPYEIGCPSCRARFQIEKEAFGREVRCPKCKERFRISKQAEPARRPAEAKQNEAHAPREDPVAAKAEPERRSRWSDSPGGDAAGASPPPTPPPVVPPAVNEPKGEPPLEAPPITANESSATPPEPPPEVSLLNTAVPTASTQPGEWNRTFPMSRGRAQLLLMVGLIAVVGARGCDVLGQRYVERTQANLKLAEAELNNSYEDRRLELQAELAEINEQEGKLTDHEQVRRQKIPGEIQELQREQAEERARLQRGAWRYLERAARDAPAQNNAAAYWRGWTFVAGAIVLSVGLLAMGLNGHAAERWVALVMLAIIAFSVFVGGTGWSPAG